MARVDGGATTRGLRVVRLLFRLRHVAPRDAIVFQPEMASFAPGVQVRKQVFERRIPAQVTIELPVIGMPRIADH